MRTISSGSSSAAVALSALLVLAATTFGTAVHAQPSASNDGTAPPSAGLQDKPAGTDKRIERIRIEDDATRIDELRYGGETQNITVQPKFGAPEYQVVPRDAARQRIDVGRDNSGVGTSGQRVWNVFGF